jgi:hypothetical protein
MAQAHYAFLDEDNNVIQVIVGRNENDVVDGIHDWEEYYSGVRGQKCKRTSFNGNIRKNFAGIGFKYDEERDAFIPKKCHEESTLDEDTCRWVCNDDSHIITEGSN